MRCPSCNYQNADADVTCNLCGAVLVTRLPSRRAVENRTSLDDRIAAHRATQRRKGMKDIQERITQKLKRLDEVKGEEVPTLLEQVKAEERELERELQKSREQLSTDNTELREAELNVRQLRKQVAALRFEVGKLLEQKQVAQTEQLGLGEEHERLRAMRDQLEESSARAPDQSADLEIQGLQQVCVRLSERVTVLTIQLQERDSFLHWLLLENDPEHWRKRVDAVREADQAIVSLDESSELLHWLRASGGPEDS